MPRCPVYASYPPRHPAAIFASYAESFFDGDYAAAAAFNPILTRYIPAMARFLRQREVGFLHVRYEELVTMPEATLASICRYLDIPFDPGALDYQRKDVAGRGLGDPVGVKKHARPVASSKDTWGAELAANRERYEVVARQIAACDPEDLATWGHPLDTFWKPMEDADPEAWKPRALAFDNFQAQRRGLRWARKLVQQSSTVNGWLGSTRRVTDVLLRDGFSLYAERGDGRPKADAEERDE